MPVIQNAIDWLSTNYGGGNPWLPRPGTFKVSTTPVLKGGVELLGHNRETTAIVADGDIGALSFDASCKYAAKSRTHATLLEALNRHRGTAIQTKDRPVEGGLWNRMSRVST